MPGLGNPFGPFPPMGPSEHVNGPPVAGGFKNLSIVNGSSATTQMTITADALTLEDESGNVYRATDISVTGTITNTGANGLDSGSVAADTWYSEWVIYSPSLRTVAALLSTSATAPTMPSGYTFKVRVGWNRTNSSSQFYSITQKGRRAQYASTRLLASAVAHGDPGVPTWEAIAVSSFVPSTAGEITVGISSVNSASNSIGMIAPNDGFGTYATGGNVAPVITYNTHSNSVTSLILESANVYVAVQSSIRCWAYGWTDNI